MFFNNRSGGEVSCEKVFLRTVGRKVRCLVSGVFKNNRSNDEVSCESSFLKQ